MSVSLSYETNAFLFSLLAGVLCSIIFDLFRCIRTYFSDKYIFVGITDLIFWLICCFICFATIYSKNHGELRLYQFSGIIISSFIYFLTISRFVKCVFSIFFKFIRFIFKIVLTPIVFLYKILVSVFLTQPTNLSNIGGTDETKKDQQQGFK